MPPTCFPIELGAMLPVVSWFCFFVQTGKKVISVHSVLRNSVETWPQVKRENLTCSRMNNHNSMALP